MGIKNKNFCIVLSSPSGAGKTSISKILLKKNKTLSLSISCTTRPIRKGEINNKDYIFLSNDEFDKKIKKNKFIEYANVFGYRYGTLKYSIESIFKTRRDVLFDIDWQGYQQLLESGMDVVVIFILPPNKRELIKRLRKRDRDTDAEMKKRMSLAKREISHYKIYNYVVVNEDIDLCVSQIQEIIKSERLKRFRQLNLNNFIKKFRN